MLANKTISFRLKMQTSLLIGLHKKTSSNLGPVLVSSLAGLINETSLYVRAHTKMCLSKIYAEYKKKKNPIKVSFFKYWEVSFISKSLKVQLTIISRKHGTRWYESLCALKQVKK